MPRIAYLEVGHAVATCSTTPTIFLVAGNQWNLGVWQLAIDHVKIGAAHAAHADFHQQLTRQRDGPIALGRFKLARAGGSAPSLAWHPIMVDCRLQNCKIADFNGPTICILQFCNSEFHYLTKKVESSCPADHDHEAAYPDGSIVRARRRRK